MFFGHKNEVLSTSGKRVILIIGGSGILGQAFAMRKPDDVLIINVSRQREISGKDIFNYRQDILKNPEKLLQQLVKIFPSIDVLINMAYDRRFSSVEKLDRETFLREIELDTFSPIQTSMLVAKYFWSKEARESNVVKNRKVINISSGATFGKTTRPELASYSGAKAALNIMTEYLHDYLFSAFGVSAHVVAPGSLQDVKIKGITVSILWELVATPLTSFTLKKIF